jgi:N-acetylglucosaminyldiphosphoundecaprenol N-acetyl-beta-D-mannosaminyltransferase
MTRANVLGCPIDRLTMAETVARCDALISARQPARQVSINAAKLVALRPDPHLRSFVSRSQIVSADGQAVVWASRILGDPLPERVAGIDLMYALLALAQRNAYGVYFLGSRPEVLEAAIAQLTQRFPGLRIKGYRDGYFAENQTETIIEEIRRTAPDILFVAMSSPRKEHFLDRGAERLGVPFAMGVGGSLDIVAGSVKRAPLWLQRAGLEWLFRFAQEPRRLVRRYTTTNMLFVFLVLREALQKRLALRTSQGTGVE